MGCTPTNSVARSSGNTRIKRAGTVGFVTGSTSATFGAETLRSTAERIEKAAKSGDQATVDQFVPSVPSQLESVLAELNRFSSSLSA